MELFGVISVPAYVVVSIVVGLLTFIHYRRNYTYFSRFGIKGPTPLPFIGTFYNIMIRGLLKGDLYYLKTYGKVVATYGGGCATLFTSDEDILRDVMVKEFSSFKNRRAFLPPGDEVLDNMLTVLKDDDWKRVRSTITPTFSTGKLKQMTSGVNACAETLIHNLGQVADNDEEFEVKESMGAFTLDVIARTGFGIAINSQTDKNDEFLVNAKEAMNFKLTNPMFLASIFIPALAPLAQKMGAKLMPQKVVDFFINIVEQTMEGRQTGDRSHQDFVQLMVNAHKDEFDASEVAKEVAEGGDVFEKTKQNSKALSKIEILSQGLVLFLAGYDTTSNGLTFLLYCLAMHPEYQRKVQEEIDSIVGDKKEISYDDVNDMTYLHQCFNEATRLYPPAPRVDRICSNAVTVKGIPLRKGDVVAISIIGRHMDPETWPEPEKFDPDRFSPEEKARHGPFDHMPFGYGPRNCIAMRLALLEVKLAAALVLKNFSLVATEKTKRPIRFKKMQMVAEDGIWMKLERRA